MAVVIRLKRMGTKKKPYFRVVVTDSRSPRDGRFIETIGTYNPRNNPVEIKIDKDKALDWVNKGAKPSETVKSLFDKVGIAR